jgi:hypothetical protein
MDMQLVDYVGDNQKLTFIELLNNVVSFYRRTNQGI